MGLGVPVERPGRDAIGPFPFQGGRQPLRHELAPHARHGAWIDVERAGNRGVRPAGTTFAVIGLEQHPGGGDASAGQPAQVGALVFGQLDPVGCGHGGGISRRLLTGQWPPLRTRPATGRSALTVY